MTREDKLRKLWIARDRDGALYIFEDKPILDEGVYEPDWSASSKHWFELLPDYIMPEVTFDNSPQQVELKLISNDKDTK